MQKALKPLEWFVPASQSDKYVTRRYYSCNKFYYLILVSYRHMFFFINLSGLYHFFQIAELFNSQHFTIETICAKFVQTESVAYLQQWPNPKQLVSSKIHFINKEKVPCYNCCSRWTNKVLKRNQERHDLILQFLSLGCPC